MSKSPSRSQSQRVFFLFFPFFFYLFGKWRGISRATNNLSLAFGGLPPGQYQKSIQHGNAISLSAHYGTSDEGKKGLMIGVSCCVQKRPADELFIDELLCFVCTYMVQQCLSMCSVCSAIMRF